MYGLEKTGRAMNHRLRVYLSTSLSTTGTSFRQDGAVLSCRHSHSRPRHFLDDFCESGFSGLLLDFFLIHIPMMSGVRSVHWSIWIKLPPF